MVARLRDGLPGKVAKCRRFVEKSTHEFMGFRQKEVA